MGGQLLTSISAATHWCLKSNQHATLTDETDFAVRQSAKVDERSLNVYVRLGGASSKVGYYRNNNRVSVGRPGSSQTESPRQETELGQKGAAICVGQEASRFLLAWSPFSQSAAVHLPIREHSGCNCRGL